MTEGICCVFDSLKLASVINSEFLINVLVFEKKYLKNIKIMINEKVLGHCMKACVLIKQVKESL